MKPIRGVSWRYLLGFAALAAVVAAGLLNQQRMMALVIHPVARLSWWLSRSLQMVGQEVYWTVLVFVVLAFGLRLLPARPADNRRAAYLSSASPVDRAAEWEKLIRRADGDEDGRLALEKALAGLHEELFTAVGEDAASAIELPPVKKGWLPVGFRRRAASLLQKAAGRRILPDNEFESGVRQILDRLESMMENKYDRE